MPAGAALAEFGLPVDVAVVFVVGFPEGEVAHVVGLILIVVDAAAGAALELRDVEVAQLPVVGERGEAEVDAAVDLVGVAFLDQALDGGDDVVDVVGRGGIGFRAFDAERVEVFEEGLGVAGGEGFARFAGLAAGADDLVLDVGQVHDVADDVAAVVEIPAQQVFEHERAQVADVGVVVDRGPAGVHADPGGIEGGELLFRAGEAVVELKGHGRTPAYDVLVRSGANCTARGLLNPNARTSGSGETGRADGAEEDDGTG